MRIVSSLFSAPKLEQLEQGGTEIGTQIISDGIKNTECSNVPIFLIKRYMGEKKEKRGRGKGYI